MQQCSKYARELIKGVPMYLLNLQTKPPLHIKCHDMSVAKQFKPASSASKTR